MHFVTTASLVVWLLMDKTDGSWSDWSGWDLCSVSCLGGLSIRTRKCNNPSTSWSGHDCIGNAQDTRICNTHYCQKRYFTKSHEWIEMVYGSNEGTVGISVYVQKLLGDIVYVELFSVEKGDVLSSDDSVGSVEAMMVTSDVYSPVSGTVTDINQKLENDPSLVNTDPYTKGWLFKIALSDPSELNKLMNKDEYTGYLQGLSQGH